MKTYKRKIAEKILTDNGKVWSNCHDLFSINNAALSLIHNNIDVEKNTSIYKASLDLNGYVLGY